MSLFATRTDLFQEIWPTPETMTEVYRLHSRIQLLRLRASLRLWRDRVQGSADEGLVDQLLGRFLDYPHSEDVLADPEFSFWFAQPQSSSSSSSMEELRSALADFARFHIVPSLRSGRAADLIVRLNSVGKLRIPGLSVHLAFDPRYAGQELTLAVRPVQPIEDQQSLIRVVEEAVSGANNYLTFKLPTDTSALSPKLTVYPRVNGITIMGETELLRETIQRAGKNSVRIMAADDPQIKKDVADAMTELERISPRFSQGVQAIVRWIVPIESKVVYSNSDSSLPGVIFVRMRTGDSLWNSELIFHEAAHNWLIALMRFDPIVNSTRDQYRSPWRKDLRPLRGILSGTHAFLLVTEYMVEKWKLADEPLGPIAQRAIFEYRRSMLGLRKLERNGKWTAVGNVFAGALRSHAAKVATDLKALKSESKVWKQDQIPYPWPCVIED